MIFKVLIVEDEDMIRKWLKFSFDWQALDCCVIADTYSSEEALKLIEMHQPHIIITDINMPVMNGLELISSAQTFAQFVPIVISGYEDFRYAQEAIHLGVLRYITKPIDNKVLAEALEFAKAKVLSLEKITMIETKTHSKVQKFMSDLNKIYKESIHDSLVKDILKYIDSNYQDKIMLKDISLKFNYSESTINSRMKSSINSTFIQYLNQYRIHKAIQLIANSSNKPLHEVAYEVGIWDLQHFNFLFKKYTGYSAKEFTTIGVGDIKLV